MKQVFAFFIKNYKFSFTITIFIVVAGVLGLFALNSETFPPVDFATAKITTIYPGSSAEEVEDRVTKKIEDQIRTIDGIRDVKSVSQPQRSDITVRVDMDNVDTEEVMNDLQRAVQRVTGLPSDILEPPKFEEINSKELPILEIALTGPNKNRQRDILADDLKTILENDKDISQVYLEGDTEREFQILLDPRKLESFHVGISEVLNAVSRRTKNIPAGFIKGDKSQTLVRVRGQVNQAAEMGEIIVRSNFSGRHIKVKDVAEVKDAHEDQSVITAINGVPATLIVAVKKANADTIRAAEKVKISLDKFRKKLPSGFKLSVFNDEATRVADRLSIVTGNAFTGLILVLIILFLFLPGSMGFMTALSLPLAILGIISLFPVMGINFNTITMLALVIVIGMLVDNSIVISENYAKLRQEGNPIMTAAIHSAYEFWLPITATVLTTISAFLPMMVTKGVMGEFIKYIPIVVTIGLIISLIESFFLLPARLQFTVKKSPRIGPDKKKGLWFERFKVGFHRFIRGCVRFRYLVLLMITGILTASICLAIFGNHFELFPAEDIEFYFARYEAPINTSIGHTEKLSLALVKEVRQTLGDKTIKNVVSKVGLAHVGLGDSQGKNGDNVGILIIQIPIEVARTLNTHNVLKKLRKISMPDFKALTFEAAAGGPPVGKPLHVTLRSTDYEELRTSADEFITHLKAIPGAVDITDDEVTGVPEFLIKLNYDKLSKLKLDTETVGIALRTALQGAIASELNLENNDFDLRIRYAGSHRQTIKALKNTKVLQPSGRLIPMTSIATIEQVKGPAVRKHYDYLRSITINGDVIPERLTSVVLNLNAEQYIASLLKKHPNVTADFGGENETTKESMESLVNAMVIAIFAIFMILVFLFNSYIKPLLVLSSVPLGLVGVNLSFYLHNKPLSFLALIGVVGLAGVVVNAAIVLISHIDDLAKKDPSKFIHYLPRAAAHRLRAVMVTSITTVIGLLPTAYGIGGYDPILVPMTLALAWGLVSGTVLTLIWVPCAYAIIIDFTSINWFGRNKNEVTPPLEEEPAKAA